MADAPKRVAVITPDGKFGTIDEQYSGEVTKAGGRVLTKAQADEAQADAQQKAAEARIQERYDALPTGRKILGGVSAAAGLVNPLLAGTSPDAPPTIAAYGAGVREGATAGFYDAGVRKMADAVGGQAAGDKYAEQRATEREASPVTTGLGSVVGMGAASALGGAGGPVGWLGAGGEALEATTAGALKNLAAKGALGRAATAAISMGARGGAEGALYNAAQATSQSLTENVDLTADKLLAAVGVGALWGAGGGAALGGLGSLAGSGLRALRGGADVPRPLPPALGEALDQEAAAARVNAPSAPEGLLSKAHGNSVEGWIEDQANESAWRATNGRKAFAQKAEKYLGDVREVGDAMHRHGVVSKENWHSGTPEDLLPRFDEPISTVGAELGRIAESSGARVPAAHIAAAFDAVGQPLASKALHEGIAKGVWDARESFLSKVGAAGPDSMVSVQDLLTQRKALGDIIYKEAKALDPGGRVGALREVYGKIEDLVENALDGASGQIPGELKAHYKGLKRDYQALTIGRDATQDSVARGVSNKGFSLTDKIIGGAAGTAGAVVGGPIGSLIAGPVAAVASKAVRERSSAALAVFLRNLGDSGTISRLVSGVDENINAASRGLIVKPTKGLLPEAGPIARPRVVALSVMKQIAALQSDPQGTIDAISKETEALGATNPALATAMTQRMTASLAFLATKMPVTADPDPMDPHQAPHMTDGQAAEFSRYAWYTQKPDRFFAEAAAGKMTPEGAETAQALMPLAFAELQSRTMDAIATHMARGRSIPFEQRLKIGELLGIAATPSQQPDHARLLQQNVVPSPSSSAASAKSRSTKLPTQQSALDRLESGGPGHR